MVTIISKSDGPRREDEAARRLIDGNRRTIARLADQFSQGAYSASRARRMTDAAGEPEPASGRLFAVGGGARTTSEPAPYVRISPNRRVVLADAENGRQIAHLGALKAVDGGLAFALATRENGFIAPADPAYLTALSDLDGVLLDDAFDEDSLAHEIHRRLALP